MDTMGPGGIPLTIAGREGLWLLATLACGALALRGLPAAGAQPSVSLAVDPAEPYVNEPVVVTINVDGAGSVRRPQFPELAHCTISYSGSGMSIFTERDFSGRVVTVRRQSYNFTLIPHRPGELVIPPIPVVIDGQTVQTDEYRLTVREVPQSPPPGSAESGRATGPGSDLLLAEITCDQSRLYVGQRASFKLTIWIRPAEYNRDRLSFAEMLRFLKGSFGPFDTENVRSRQVRRPAGDGRPTDYYVVELPAEFIVEQPGSPSFAEVSLALDYPVRYARSFFGEVRVFETLRVRVRPTVAVPDVQPLPQENRPASFSGAVGRYELRVHAEPTRVRVGDPITLTIDIIGDPVETLPGPELAATPQLVADFRVPDETLAGTVTGNRKRFTQVIRARRADVKAVPPLEFAYFDPYDGRYVVARSAPIPLVVEAVEQLDASDLTDVGPGAPEETGGVEARDGLRGIKTAESELLASVRPVTLTQVALGTFLPPVGFLLLWSCSLLARRQQDAATRRRRAARRNAERRLRAAAAGNLSPGEFHRQVAAALAGYLADRRNEPAARFLGRAALDFLRTRGVNRELLARCEELIERCERASYGAESEDRDPALLDLARDCLRRLEREAL